MDMETDDITDNNPDSSKTLRRVYSTPSKKKTLIETDEITMVLKTNKVSVSEVGDVELEPTPKKLRRNPSLQMKDKTGQPKIIWTDEMKVQLLDAWIQYSYQPFAAQQGPATKKQRDETLNAMKRKVNIRYKNIMNKQVNEALGNITSHNETLWAFLWKERCSLSFDNKEVKLLSYLDNAMTEKQGSYAENKEKWGGIMYHLDSILARVYFQVCREGRHSRRER